MKSVLTIFHQMVRRPLSASASRSQDSSLRRKCGSALKNKIYTFVITKLTPLLHCICEILCMSTRWVRILICTVLKLSSIVEKKSWQSRDLNPGPLDEKRKRYLCAMQSQSVCPSSSSTLTFIYKFDRIKAGSFTSNLILVGFVPHLIRALHVSTFPWGLFWFC